MSKAAGESIGECPSEEIGAYLDTELPPDRTSALETHFAECAVCRDELNSQKAFLLELSRTLEKDTSIELPKDFTRAIVTKAESGVSGLRKRSERLAALGIVALLVVLATVGYSGDWGRASADAARPVNSVGAILEVSTNVIYSLVFTLGFIFKKAFPGSAGLFVGGILLVIAVAFGFLIIRRFRRVAQDVG